MVLWSGLCLGWIGSRETCSGNVSRGLSTVRLEQAVRVGFGDAVHLHSKLDA